MVRKLACLSFLSFFVLLSVSSPCRAGIYRVFFQTYTTAQPDGVKRLDFWVEISDSNGLRGPDAIDWSQPVTITAPTGEVFALQEGDYQEWHKGFGPSRVAADFTAGAISNGKYTFTLAGKIAGADTLGTVKFLPVPVITYPKDSTTISSLTPKFTWKAVTGAQFYRVDLVDMSREEPVYYRPSNPLNVYDTKFTVPKGVLVSGHQYKLRIEARDSDKNMKARSRSLWIFFTAP